MSLKDICKADFAATVASSANRKIPWDEPGFSRRMLAEHLSQEHDLASRRTATIKEHIEWIHRELLGGKQSNVLDVCCGPGFYAERLADKGHRCTGIDFSPASIAYAIENSRHKDKCEYIQADVCKSDYGNEFDAAYLIFGEFNTFTSEESKSILDKMYTAIKPGGQILIEATALDTIETIGKAGNSWYAAEAGLFSDDPHIVLMSNSWKEEENISEQQFNVIDAGTSKVDSYRCVNKAYSDDEFKEMLLSAGFSRCEVIPAWGKENIEESDIFLFLRAWK